MGVLLTVLRYEMLFLPGAFVVLIAYLLLTQQINVTGLLLDKTSGRAISPGRLQMLIVTMSIAMYYVFMVVDAKDTSRLPNMPQEFLIALSVSHTIYLGGKFYGSIASKFGLASPKMRERAKPKNGG